MQKDTEISMDGTRKSQRKWQQKKQKNNYTRNQEKTDEIPWIRNEETRHGKLNSVGT